METDREMIVAAVKEAAKASDTSINGSDNSTVGTMQQQQQGKLYGMLEQMGNTFMKQWQMDAQEKMVACLPSPERKEMRREQARLLLAETRLKAQQTEAKLTSTTISSASSGDTPSPLTID